MGRFFQLSTAFLALALVSLFAAASAVAAEGREFSEVLGSVEQPAFNRDEGLAVDLATGDVLVIDVGPDATALKALSRFKPNGEPDPFSALGTNIIDGKLGPGGKECAEEPSSCDKTPNNEIVGFTVDPREVQVAVAPPGAAGGTGGNIYINAASDRVVHVFAPTGEYLGQLTEYKEGPGAEGPAVNLGEACGVAVDPAGAVYVSDFSGQIHKYIPSANPPLNTDNTANFPATKPCTLAAGVGATAGFLFVNNWQSGDLFKLDAGTGESKYQLGAGGHTTVAVDPQTGHVLAAVGSEVEEYDAAGAGSATLKSSIEAGSTVEGVAAYGNGVAEDARAYVTRSEATQLDVYGPFEEAQPPAISDVFVERVTPTEVTLKAKINPKDFLTTFHVDYGLNTSYGQSTGEISVGSDNVFHTVNVILRGLRPGTNYHWQMVATSEAGSNPSEDHTFTTYLPIPALDTNCPNQAFRTAASAFLPDCRAYEMVSPVDKNGGDIVSGLSLSFNPGGYMQASPDGKKITYTARSSFGDEENSFVFNQYLSTRQAGEGWSNHGIHPPVAGSQPENDDNQFGAFRDFIAFSPDLCSAWLVDYQTPPPTLDGQEGHRNLYRRDNCAPDEGSLEALIPSSVLLPPSATPIYVDPQSVQGVSEDSRHAIFIAGAKLNSDAAETGSIQVYDRFGGAIHLVSVLPSGEPDKTGASVGSDWGANLDGAVSADGSRVYWTSGPGKIYLRQHPEQGIVAGECEPGKACTLPVSEDEALFWGASVNGSKALYSEGSLDGGTADLYEFDLQGAEESPPQPPQLIASNVRGVAGASEDLSRIYFVSTGKLTGVPNSKGNEAQAGQPNLYLEEAGTFSFVATLSEGDVGAAEPGFGEVAYHLVSRLTYHRATRVSADGARIVFESRAPLTGFDNSDADSGKPGLEVFTYEAGGGLDCVSCNPSGARPSTRRLPLPYSITEVLDKTGVIAAAWIPTWEHPLHDSNVLSEDGGRLFFNSNDALVLSDTNGAQDVYEWEVPGFGSCDVEDANYFPQNGGCLSLISTGESAIESEFWEASPDGRNVFFTTESSLLPQDPGSIDLYDARVEGGIPQPIPPEECEGEACQDPPPAPPYNTPASSSYRGPVNGPRPCPKGKHRVRRAGKARCVKRKHRVKHKRGQQRRADNNQRAAQ